MKILPNKPIINTIQKPAAYLYKSKGLTSLAHDTVEIHKPNAAKIGIAKIIAALLNQKQADTFTKCMELRNTENFDKYKNEIIKFFRENSYPSDRINDIKKTENKHQLDFELDCLQHKYLNFDDFLIDEDLNILERIEKQDFSPELDKTINDLETKNADLAIPIAKLISETDSNPDVLKIKSEIQNKYNLKEIYLNNDIEFSQGCKEALEILEKNNIRYNGTIIANDKLDAVGINLQSSNGNCVIINQRNWQRDESITHIVLHEILHSLQPRTLEFKTKQIPKEFEETANNISNYASDKYALEVHCELYVKKLLQELSDKEEALFSYLGGTFLE